MENCIVFPLPGQFSIIRQLEKHFKGNRYDRSGMIASTFSFPDSLLYFFRMQYLPQKWPFHLHQTEYSIVAAGGVGRAEGGGKNKNFTGHNTCMFSMEPPLTINDCDKFTK